jgi:hypothetical protein
MTAFTTRSSKSRPDGLARRIAATLLLLAFSLFSHAAGAGEIKVKQAELVAGEEAWLVNAEFAIALGQRLEEVVDRGVPLYFVAEFALTKPRWYWADEHVAGKSQTWRLAYNALTRQYRLSSGALHQSFVTLDEALAVLARLRDWEVADKPALKAGESYSAALRLKLDLTQLPKPFQVDAIGNKDWNIKAEIRRWSVTPAAEAVPK